MPDENLPAEYIDPAEFMRLSGQSGGIGNQLPTLRVNYADSDDNGNTLPRGKWTIYTDKGAMYADNAIFRPYHSTFQYSHYDQDEEKMVAKSVHFYSFADEIPDDAGGLKCGKLSAAKRNNLSEAEQKIQKDIKCSKVFYGLVSLKGKLADGNDYEVENMECVFYAKGSNFMPMANFIEELTKSRIAMQTIRIQLDLQMKKNGGVTYWECVPTKYDEVDLTKEDYDLHTTFHETVQAENAVILGKWDKARQLVTRNTNSGQAHLSVTTGAKDELSDPLDDLTGDLEGDLDKITD